MADGPGAPWGRTVAGEAVLDIPVEDALRNCGLPSVPIAHGVDRLVEVDLQQVGKALTRDVSSDIGFGGYAVVLIGDFGQVPPVLSTSLLPDPPIADGKQGNMRALAMAGQRRFQDLHSAIRLRRVDRMSCPAYDGLLLS